LLGTLIEESADGLVIARDITGAERSKIRQALDVLDRDIARAASSLGRMRAERALSQALLGFEQCHRMADVQQIELVASYVAALRDVPIAALEEACALVTSGQFAKVVPDWKPGWPPSAPQIALAAAERAERLLRWEASLRRPLTVRRVALPPETPDQRAANVERVRRAAEAFKRGADARAEKHEAAEKAIIDARRGKQPPAVVNRRSKR
jgi:hypothetical protein